MKILSIIFFIRKIKDIIKKTIFIGKQYFEHISKKSTNTKTSPGIYFPYVRRPI